MNNRLRKLVLLQGDIILLYLSLFLTLTVRYGQLPSVSGWKIHVTHFTMIFVVWLLIFYISDLYNLNYAVNNSRFRSQSARAIFASALIAVAYFYANPRIAIAPKTNLLIFILVFSVLFFLWRRFYNYSLSAYLPKNNLAFIGFNPKVKELIGFLRQHSHLGFRPVLVVEDPELVEEKIKTIEYLSDIKPQFSKNNIRYAILTTDTQHSSELRSALFSTIPLGINFVSLPNFYEKITGKVPLDAINQAWFLENLNEADKGGFSALKRFYDIVLALTLLALTAPAWPLIGLLLKLENREPVFFTQTRVGKNKAPFRILKFRTQKTVSENPAPAAAQDDRTTRVGAFLRRTRIDEIPQMLNILKGDMSFVGPRPERPEIAASLEKQIPFYNERTLVKPGVTGWDQVSGEYHSPSLEDSLKKLQYDLYYVKNRSLYLDLSIFLKTIRTILSRSGV